MGKIDGSIVKLFDGYRSAITIQPFNHQTIRITRYRLLSLQKNTSKQNETVSIKD